MARRTLIPCLVDPNAPLRLGVVSYLNTLPLIDGLDRLHGLELRHSVPALLIDDLVASEVEMALCSTVDYQRSPVPLRIVPVGMLGCRGPTLTVRLYSAVPVDRIRVVCADTDSHTSIELLRILLRERFGVQPEILPFNAREAVAAHRLNEYPESMLLIGDKVVRASPLAVRYPHQLDLGAAWFEHTGLPFVFATWMVRRDADPARIRDLAAILDHQRRHNLERLDGMIHRAAETRGWPRDLAAHYLRDCLRFELDQEARAGLEKFLDKARAMGLLGSWRPLEFFDPALGEVEAGCLNGV
jgi:chorismate dehydratase